jgi:CDP-paratose 2-epimerase
VPGASQGRRSSCSVLEAIDLCQQIAGRRLSSVYDDAHRLGDHRWWIGSTGRFESDYPGWRCQHDLRATLEEIHDAWR